MKKMNSKQMFTYVVMFGVLILIMVYFFVYKKNVEKAEALNASNNTLEERVDSLQVYADNQKQYEADMEKMEPEIKVILDKYPAANLEEDVIMQAVITQMSTPIIYDAIVIGEDEAYKSIPADIVSGADIDEYQQEINFVETNAVYESSLTYEALKQAVQSIFDSKYMIGIKGISYTKTENEVAKENAEEGVEGSADITGEFVPDMSYVLNGNMELVFYSVEGNGKEYVKPNILPYISGTTNFFSDLMAVVEVEEEQ